ncbi:response regulator transcription factor [Martelella lutilitoris]|mgnify:FL=1|uniref:Response regulator transcription factor n=1 Tax=Martelella lutilitoris TaxID=2583532 RepID=A0A7T7KL08_9HYPH|nr:MULTISPECIES: response regulator transcription factor [Martelella]AMM85675.1 LuxR family transcriptional regulator [Martelella sp. AD-3]MAM13289.1 DNA-binding response regulator [Rhizobiaceae bacterium]QQM30185.1 response regulator transcription factor [Martelella lutilitoris]
MTGQTILIADDHPLFRSALKQAISGMATYYAVVEAGDFDGVQLAARENPEADLLLLDLAMPGVSGLSGLITLKAEFSSLPIVVISASDDDDTIRRSLALGASGFISKSAGIDELRNGIRTVLSGEIYTPENFEGGEETDPDIADMLERLQTLTPQQSRVLRMLCEGLLNKQIAYELGVSEATVKAHVSAILLKLNVDSRTQAVIQLGKVNMAMVA